MRITYVGFWSELTGYGRACRDNVKALVEAGHDVAVLDWKSLGNGELTTSPETRYEELDDLVRPWANDSFDGRAVVYHGQPRLLASMADQHRVWPRSLAMTTWETSSFPLAWADLITGSFGAVAVPSSWCKAVVEPALSRHLDYPVHVVPHGFDPNFWTERSGVVVASHRAFYTKPPRTPGEVRFYTLGAWSERKNPLAIVRAFLHAFTASDNVSLTIRSPDANVDQVRSILARSGLSRDVLPRIEISAPAPMSECELYALHLEHDVFVSASRAEGWGLPLFEACVVGNRVITPTGTGENEFLYHDDAVYRGLVDENGVESALEPCFAGESRTVMRDGAVAGVVASVVPGMTCKQTWRAPSIADIARMMRECVDGPNGDPRNDGEFWFGREMLERRFGYPSIAAAITHALESCS